MLTVDLVRARTRGGEIVPLYVNEGDGEFLGIASALIRMFREHTGKPLGELKQSLHEYIGAGTAFLLHRGLAKLLMDRCEFLVQAEVTPPDLRRDVFTAAAELYRSPESIFLSSDKVTRAVADRLGLAADEIHRSLYADLKDQQVLSRFDACEPEWLLTRYNAALAQAVILRAVYMQIHVSGLAVQQYRALFRQIKFHQLLHTTEGNSATGYHVYLDGPFSIFKSSQRYGVQMARFLPVMFHFDNWEIEARILWGKKRREYRFQLSSRAGLRPFTRLTGQWQPGEMAWFPEQFEKLDTEWSIARGAELIDLGGKGVIVPDYVFTHGPTGKRVYMEIFGFWRKRAILSRIESLRASCPANFILAISRDLHVDEEIEDLPAEVYVFRSVPIAREVRERLQLFH